MKLVNHMTIVLWKAGEEFLQKK